MRWMLTPPSFRSWEPLFQVLVDAIREIQEERKRVKQLQDEVYGKMVDVRRERQAKQKDYYDNRRFSKQARALV
jgi:hypothetical protein